VNARLKDAAWRNACCEVPAGECAHWMEPAAPMAEAQASHPREGLCAEGLGVTVGDSTLLQTVDLHLHPGEVGAILGPNGAGKSTLLSVLAGLRKPTAGQVWLNGVPLAGAAAAAASLARHRAVLPQDSAVAFDFSVEEVVMLGRYPHRRQPSPDETGIVRAALAATGMAGLAHRSVASLSGGERARAHLARVMAQIWVPCADGSDRWLLLDEPTAALDLRHQHQLLATVRRWAREQGVGVLAVLHDLNLALRYTDRVWVLEQGRLRASGAPVQVLSEALVQAVWQVHASGVQGADGVRQLIMAAEGYLPATPTGKEDK
jgi:iron complex transport system ATP-binding protein